MEEARIVYVEDRPADAELFRRALLQMRPKSKLLHFRDGQSAKDFLAVANSPPELVAVDIHLPGLGGKELIRWIREQAAMRELPIIALSGSQAFKTAQEAEENGANLFLLKPPNYDGWIDLLYRIEDFLAPI